MGGKGTGKSLGLHLRPLGTQKAEQHSLPTALSFFMCFRDMSWPAARPERSRLLSLWSWPQGGEDGLGLEGSNSKDSGEPQALEAKIYTVGGMGW